MGQLFCWLASVMVFLLSSAGRMEDQRAGGRARAWESGGGPVRLRPACYFRFGCVM